MSLAELQALATSVRIAPHGPVVAPRTTVVPKYATTMLLAFDSTPAWPGEKAKVVRRRFTGRRSA